MTRSFPNTGSWIKNHCNLCLYSLDIKRCTNASCCGPSRAKEATDFLLNNGFLPPITKAKDEHFTNPIHLLEYYDLLKIPGYDSHCSSLDQTTYSCLRCSVCNKYFPTLAYLTKHKKAMHTASWGRPKRKSKNNSNSLDDSSLLTSQQNEMCLRKYMSDNE
uniref:C2H2-type domain-containing protein n=1 Tax=Rhizophagus irregularis (strain DAOM 181602 / DAOM 197198 / MUCL 43194) TaxID=747089 RepID=U9SI80_RHIID